MGRNYSLECASKGRALPGYGPPNNATVAARYAAINLRPLVGAGTVTTLASRLSRFHHPPAESKAASPSAFPLPYAETLNRPRRFAGGSLERARLRGPAVKIWLRAEPAACRVAETKSSLQSGDASCW